MNTRIAFGLMTTLAIVTACGGEVLSAVSTATTTGSGANTTTGAQTGATSGQGGGSAQTGATSGQTGVTSGQGGSTSGQGGSNGANALCPGLASEYAMGGQGYRDAFIDACTKNPLCVATGGLVDKNDCSTTITTIKSISADFKNVCENGGGQANPPNGTANASCSPACTDLFDCAVSSN